MGEAQDAFIIFDEAYEGNDVDAFYLGDILRALGCNVTNAAVEAAGGATELGQKKSPSPTSSPSSPPSRLTPPPPETRRVPARSPSLRSRTSSALSVRSSRTTKPPSSANFSASSLMRRTTSPTWTSSTSSLPLPTKCLCSPNKAKEHFRSRNKN